MSTHNNVTQKTELALHTYLAGTTNPPPNLYRGLTADTVTLPSVAVSCTTAEHAAPFSGTWDADGQILIRSNADDVSEDVHMDRAGALMDMLMTDTIAEDLTDAIEDFTCLQFVVRRQSHQINERSFESTLEFMATVCGSDLE